MKLKLTLILTAAILVAPAAFAGIDGSAHDLSSDATGWAQEVCVYCHTPHSARVAVPLWNRTAVTGTFSMYSSTTMNATADGTTSGIKDTITGMCLSCHDGSTAVAGGVYNWPNNNTDTQNTSNMGAIWGTDKVLGTDLRDDHPVNVTYTTGTGTEMFASPQNTAVKLDANSKVQCSSCHDPHDDTNTPFLVLANTDSALCFDCHDK